MKQELKINLMRKKLKKRLIDLVEGELEIIKNFAEEKGGIYQDVKEAGGVIEASVNQLRYFNFPVFELYEKYLEIRRRCDNIYSSARSGK